MLASNCAANRPGFFDHGVKRGISYGPDPACAAPRDVDTAPSKPSSAHVRANAGRFPRQAHAPRATCLGAR